MWVGKLRVGYVCSLFIGGIMDFWVIGKRGDDFGIYGFCEIDCFFLGWLCEYYGVVFRNFGGWWCIVVVEVGWVGCCFVIVDV